MIWIQALARAGSTGPGTAQKTEDEMTDKTRTDDTSGATILPTESLELLAAVATRAGTDACVLPGTDLGRCLADHDITRETLAQWEDSGWVRLAGDGVVLTQAGYRAI